MHLKTGRVINPKSHHGPEDQGDVKNKSISDETPTDRKAAGGKTSKWQMKCGLQIAIVTNTDFSVVTDVPQ